MARFSGAQWRPIYTNYSSGGNSPRLLIVHIMQGTLNGTDSWFRNPAAQVSAHFGVGKDGTVYQWVDTNDRAWHAMAANSYAVGVECEGYAGTELTGAQFRAVAEIFAWAHQVHPAVSAWLNTRPFTGSGLSWHGLGGDAWGGHTGCPGQPIVDQLPGILATAQLILNPPKPPEPKPEWVWTVGDKLPSLVSISEQSSTPVSTILKYTVQKFGSFTSGLSNYLQAGDLNAPMPKGEQVVIRPAPDRKE